MIYRIVFNPFTYHGSDSHTLFTIVSWASNEHQEMDMTTGSNTAMMRDNGDTCIKYYNLGTALVLYVSPSEVEKVKALSLKVVGSAPMRRGRV